MSRFEEHTLFQLTEKILSLMFPMSVLSATLNSSEIIGTADKVVERLFFNVDTIFRNGLRDSLAFSS